MHQIHRFHVNFGQKRKTMLFDGENQVASSLLLSSRLDAGVMMMMMGDNETQLPTSDLLLFTKCDKQQCRRSTARTTLVILHSCGACLSWRDRFVLDVPAVTVH